MFVSSIVTERELSARFNKNTDVTRRLRDYLLNINIFFVYYFKLLL